MGSPELCYFPFGLLVLTFWVNADAATDLTAAGVRGLLNSFAAVDATRAEVCSFAGFFVDMIFSFYSSRKVERRESGPTDSRRGWIRQKAASDPDVSASAAVCAHEDASPTVVGHGQLLMKIEGVWACQHTANW